MIPFIIFLSFFLVPTLSLLTFVFIVPSIKRKKQFKAFIAEHPEYVKLRVLYRSLGTAYKIKVFSVNRQEPVADKYGDVFLPIGDNDIVAQYETINDNWYALILLGAIIGGIIGVIIYSIVIYKSSSNSLTNKKGVYINLKTVKNGYYELKANPSERKIITVSIVDEKHEIQSYT